jgi:hypothetical protein
VRIEKNPSLCYVNTINWKNIIMDDVVIKNDHFFIEENMDSNAYVFDLFVISELTFSYNKIFICFSNSNPMTYYIGS